jgi:hypothetical protein
MKPREKIINLGVESLNDEELLMLFIGSGFNGLTARDIARSLLDEFRSLNDVFRASPEELMNIEGVGVAISSRLVAVGEIMRRVIHKPLLQEEYVIIMCANENTGVFITGIDNEITIAWDLTQLPCKDVVLYHSHGKEKMPSISDEWLVLYLKEKGLNVIKYEIMTSNMDIYDVLSKVDYMKGE